MNAAAAVVDMITAVVVSIFNNDFAGNVFGPTTYSNTYGINWSRRLNSTSSYTSFPTNLADQLYGNTQEWYYAKFGIWASPTQTVAGNLGYWGNTVIGGYSVVLGTGLNAEWYDIAGEIFIIIS